MTALTSMLIAQLALAQAPVLLAAETPRQEQQQRDVVPPAPVDSSSRTENPGREEPPPDVINEAKPANPASPNEAPGTAPDAIDAYTAAANQVMVKDPTMRKVPRAVFFSAAAVGIGILVFSCIMDGLAYNSRSVAATSPDLQASISAQNHSIGQTNAANAGFAISAVFAVGLAVLAGFVNWVD